MSLDPATADLLQAVVDLDEGTWSASPSDRSVALAMVSGALRAVVRGDASPANAAAAIRAHLDEFDEQKTVEVGGTDGMAATGRAAAEPAHAVWGYDWVPEPPEGTTT